MTKSEALSVCETFVTKYKTLNICGNLVTETSSV